jgi:hypothetical protein
MLCMRCMDLNNTNHIRQHRDDMDDWNLDGYVRLQLRQGTHSVHPYISPLIWPVRNVQHPGEGVVDPQADH